MLLSVNHLDVPVATNNWQDVVAGKLGNPRLQNETASYVGLALTKPWQWAREAERSALALAEALPEGASKEEAKRLAKRHAGVWRSANKMHRVGPTGRMQRTVVAVRAEAGDASCPSWLKRRSCKQIRLMTPVIQACHRLGYFIAKAAVSSVGRATAKSLVEELNSLAVRSQV